MEHAPMEDRAGETRGPRVVPEQPPASLFEIVDWAITTTLDRLDHADERDAEEGESEEHFLEWVRWRVAIVNEAVLQIEALLTEGSTVGGRWRAGQGRA